MIDTKGTFHAKMEVEVKLLSRVWLFVNLWTVARQTPLFMGFSIQEYWSGLPRPPPGDLPDPGIEPKSPALQADALPSEPPGKSIKMHENVPKLKDKSESESESHSVMSDSLRPHGL